jgi:hypothetical protein
MAMQNIVDVHETPVKALDEPGAAGRDWIVQLVPSQPSARSVRVPPLGVNDPTAMQKALVAQETPDKDPSGIVGSGTD